MFPTPLDEIQMRGQVEYAKERGNQAPPPRPGDRYILTGALVGVIVGLIIAFIVGIPWVYIVGIIGGGIVGTSLGSLIGFLITKYQERSKNNLRYY